MASPPPGFNWQQPVQGVAIFSLSVGTTEVGRVEKTAHEPPRWLVSVDRHLAKGKTAYARTEAVGRGWVLAWAHRERVRILAEVADIEANRALWCRR